MNKKFIFLTVLIASLIMACKKEGFIEGPNASIHLSEDTLFFDTVFTTTGSITQFFRIYNDNDQKLRVSDVSLA